MLGAIEYGSNILVEFDMIVDTEVGLMRLIKDEYCNGAVFDESILNLNDHLMKGLLMERFSPNPLIVPFRDSSKTEMMDSFYNQFFERRYDDILSKSCSTAITKLVKKFVDTEGVIRVTILCEDEKQKLIAKELFKDCLMSLIYFDVIKDDTYDVKLFSELFVRDVRRLPRYSNLSGKTIYLARYNHNLDKDLMERKILFPLKDYAILYADDNQFRIVTLYSYDNSYSINGDYIDDTQDDTDDDVRKLEEEQIDNSRFIERVFGPGYLNS